MAGELAARHLSDLAGRTTAEPDVIRPEQVWLAVDPVYMRWGMDRLSAYVQHAIGRIPCDGSVYAFTNRDRSRLKL